MADDQEAEERKCAHNRTPAKKCTQCTAALWRMLDANVPGTRLWPADVDSFLALKNTGSADWAACHCGGSNLDPPRCTQARAGPGGKEQREAVPRRERGPREHAARVTLGARATPRLALAARCADPRRRASQSKTSRCAYMGVDAKGQPKLRTRKLTPLSLAETRAEAGALWKGETVVVNGRTLDPLDLSWQLGNKYGAAKEALMVVAIVKAAAGH